MLPARGIGAAFCARGLRFALSAGVAASLAAGACNEKRAVHAPSDARQPRPAASASPAANGAPSARVPVAAPPSVTLPEPIDEEHLRATLPKIAKERVPGSKHWQRVQALCAEQLEKAGYQVERHAYGSGVNVLGVRPGLQKSARRVVVSAHYDHIRGCEGADDNASGVAALLELSRVLAQARFANDLVIAFWDEEERGLLGSRAYSARARSRAEQIVGAYSLDAVGFASKKPRSQRVPAGFDALFPEHKALLEQRQYAADFIAVVGNGAARPLLESVQRQARVAGLPLMSLELSSLQGLLLRDAYRSDHASFWAEGYSAVLLSDTANFRNPGYHCERAPDSPASIDYAFLARVATTAALSALELLVPVP